MILLDTNVVSELRLARAGRANPSVVKWADAQPENTLFVSAMSIFELEIGVGRVERRDPRQGAALRSWIDSFLRSGFAGRILPVDGRVAMLAATRHIPDPAPIADSLIAATAMVHGMTIATRNTADFQGLPVPVINPWLL